MTNADPSVAWSSTTATVTPATGATSVGSNLAVGTNTFEATITYHDGCEETHDIDVTVNPLPNITVNSPTICSGETAHLTADGGVSYTWTSGVTVTGTATADASPTTTTSYTVTGTDANGCTNTAVATVTVNPNPTANAGSDVTICTGSSTTLNASGGTTYSWSPGTGLSSSTISNPVATPTSTTNYTVTVSIGSCSNTDVVTVTVNTTPTITVNSVTICSGETANLTASGGTSYSWSAGATSTGTNTANASPTTTTSYTVTGTGSNGCTNTAVAIVTVNPTPAVPVITGADACYDLANTYTITNYDNTLTYDIGLLPLIPSPGTVGSLNTTAGTFPVTWNSPTGGTILVQVTNSYGCVSEGELEVDADNCICDGTHITNTNWSNAFSLTANTLYALNTNATVTGNNVVLTNATINMAPGISIYIGAGKKLTLDHCHLFACTDMWQGLFVDDGGELIITGGSLIEDAYIAADVPTSTGTPTAILTVNGAIFNKNRTGIRVMDYQQTVSPYPFTIRDAVFTSKVISYTTSTSTWATTAALKTIVNSGAINEHYAVGDLTSATLAAPFAGQKALEGINLEDVGTLSGSFYEIQIGENNTNATMNVFDNLLFGVNALNSNFTCYNNSFQNILKQSSPSPSGIAVNAVSTIPFFTDNRIRVMSDATAGHGPNYFYDCSWGVNTDRYYDITISNCDMRSTGAPVYPAPLPVQGEVGIYVKTPNASQITVDANTITAVQNGIVFFGDDANSVVIIGTTYSDAQEIGDVYITNNTIQATLGSTTPTNQYAYIGILAANLMNYAGSNIYAPPSPHYIHHVNVNDNHLHNVHNGIGMYNWFNFTYLDEYGLGHYPVSDRNFVSLRQIIYPNTSAQTQVGIQHNLDWNSEIVENNIIGFGNTNDIWSGINVVDNIPFVYQTIMCNRVENTGTGIQFVGSPNSTTTFFNNTMEGSGKGFVLDHAAIGDQGDNISPESSKNLWPASSYASGQYKTFTKNASTSASTAPLNSILYIDGTTDPDQNPETGGLTFNSNDIPSVTLTYSSTLGSLAQITGTDINSVNCTVPSSIVPPTGGGNRSMTSIENQIEQLEKMVLDSIEYNYFTTEQRINDKFKVYRTLVLNPLLKDSSAVLQNFFTVAQTGNIGKLAEAEAALAAGVLTDAENLINAISPDNAIETNYFNYCLNYLHYKNNTYTSADSSSLKTIANGCPVKDGMVVYQARNLYSLIYTYFMMYTDNCADDNASRLTTNAVNKQKQEDFILEISPNPNSGSFNLFINGNVIIDEQVEVNITDFTGKLINSSIMQLKNNYATFDMGLGNGMYIVSVKGSKGLIGKPKKVTVIR